MFRMTSNHVELQSAARQYFEQRSDLSTTAAHAEPDAIRGWWAASNDELGLAAALVPEACGGLGLDFGFTAVLLEESGRALLDAPLFPVAAAAQLLARGSGARAEELLTEIGSGQGIVGLALGGTAGGPTPIKADAGDDRAELVGEFGLVLYADCLDVLLVEAADPEGQVGVFSVRCDDPCVTITPLTGMDLRRRAGDVALQGAVGQRIDLGADPAAEIDRAHRIADIALAVEQLGAAHRAMEMAVEYARTREQFGRPIGSFQSIKHRCAEMLIRVERARSMVFLGITRILDDEDLTEAAALAQAVASEALDWVAYENIQVHGGIGFTWEHPAHFFARRATSSRTLLGTPHVHRERLIAHLAAGRGPAMSEAG